MAEILCLTSGLMGIAYASFELTHRLEEAGHRVQYGSPRPIADLAEANGIQYKQLAPVNFFPAGQEHVGGGLVQRLRKWKDRLVQRKQRRVEAVEALGMDEFAHFLRTTSPDLIIIDIELHEHIMTAVAMGIPTVLLSQWFSLWQQPGLPPLMQQTIPGEGWRGSSWGLAWTWWCWRWQRRWIFGKKSLRTVGTHRRAILREYARKIGFSHRYIPHNYWPGPFTYSGLPMISMTMQEMEFPHMAHPNLTYVGAMVNDQRRDVKHDNTIDSQLSSVFARCEQEGNHLICCTVSTFKAGDTVFLQRLIAAVGRRPEWRLVVGLGAKLKVTDLGEIPENVHPFPWIPQLKVLAKADCSINHGGIHTINECIHCRVPMLVYSGKRSDQNGCAARVHYHQLGIMADKDRDDSATIELKIENVLENPSFRESLERMHQQYEGYHQKEVLTSYVVEFLDQQAKQQTIGMTD
ncbi:MAG: glycosyltransferase [Bacteroidota bacterium]